MALEAPHRQVVFGKEVWDLYADHRAWNLIELTTKRSYRHWIRRLLNKKSSKLEPVYLLLWAFSARHRAHQKVSLVLSIEDRILGAHYPSEFLDLLPQRSEDFGPFRRLVNDMLEECDLISYETVPATGEEAPAKPEQVENPTLSQP